VSRSNAEDQKNEQDAASGESDTLVI
jgi:hypothetical protein